MARRRSRAAIGTPERTVADATAWFGAAADAWLLGVEAAQVIGLRTARLAAGGTPAARETALMITEKLAAAAEIQARLVTGGLGATPLSVASGAISHYRGKVGANRRRLSRRTS